MLSRDGLGSVGFFRRAAVDLGVARRPASRVEIAWIMTW